MSEKALEPRDFGVALVGLGYWGKNLARVFNQLGVLCAVVDASAERRARFSEQYPEAASYASVDEVLGDPAVSAIAVATPPRTHAIIARRALRAGRDVYVEKPLCYELAEAETLRELSDRLGHRLMVGHLLRYHPAFVALEAIVTRGELGEVRYLETRRTNLGRVTTERSVLWNFAPHDLSLILSLAGNRTPDTVRCEGVGVVSGSACDAATLTLRFSEPKIVAQAYVGWLNPIKEARLSVAGTVGAAVFDDTRPWPEKLQRFDGHHPEEDPRVAIDNRTAPAWVAVPQGEPLLAEAEHFVTCCRHQRTPRTGADEGVRVMATLDAAQRSLGSGGAEVRLQAG
ncbi:MAG: Gfo/Idh/MocA family oxidoreductase [Planctomycetota bacterium]